MELYTLRSPIEMYAQSPALLAAETITYLTFLLCFLHAYRNGGEHMLLLAITLVAASAVDPFCLISPQIRNYYHDHASLLLADRHVAPWQFPLFCDLAYLGAAAVWRLQLPLKVELAAVAVVNSYTFYPADQFFCKWLVYQWHDSDPLYADRNGAGSGQCVPAGSSMWVMTYGITGSLVARYAAKKYYDQGTPLRTMDVNWCRSFLLGVLVFLPGHIFPLFPLFYAPIAMIYGDATLAVRLFFGMCAVYWAQHWWLNRPTALANNTIQHVGARQSTQVLVLAALVWFGGLTCVGLFIPPESVRSLSVHQPFGGQNEATSALCGENETYLFGLPGATRKKYMCSDHFRFWQLCKGEEAGNAPQPGDETYAICGTKGDAAFWWEYFSAIGIGVGLHLFCLAATAHAGQKEKKNAQEKTKKKEM